MKFGCRILLAVAALSGLVGARAGAQGEWQVTYPPPFKNPTWLNTHQRLAFGVYDKELEQAVEAGTNVICGGTNAAGLGFAGGPWILAKDGKNFVEVINGTPVPSSTIREVRARVDRAHALGAKVVGEVIRFNMTPWIQAEHPDWQDMPSPGGKPISVEELKNSHVLGCWNSPYGDWFIKSQVELVKQLDWDGYNMDGFGCWSQCYCPYCTKAYFSDTGKEIPPGIDVNNSEWRHYLKWKLDRYTHFVHKWTAALKEVKPDFVAAPWTTGPGRWWHWMGAPASEGTDALHRVLDAPFLELMWDFPPDQGSNLLPAFTVRYYRGLTGDRPAWILPYLCEQGQFNMQPPKAESELREMTIVTNGCLVSQGIWQQNAGHTMAEMNKELEKREPFTTGAKSLKWAAMLVGESSRLMVGLAGVRNEVPIGSWMGSGVDSVKMGATLPNERRMPAHMESAVGVFRAMMEDQLPLDIVIEQDVEDIDALMQYQVLILPNAGCLSAKAVANIKAFVNAGRGILSMHESSLYNEFGDQQSDFQLADIYGAHYKGKEDFSARWPNYDKWTEIYLGIAAPDLNEISDDPVVRSNYRRGTDRLHYIGWMTNVEAMTGAVKFGRRLTIPVEWPFAILNKPGQGRSAYYACDLGQAYFIAPYQYQRRLITNAVRWAAGTKPPVTVQAPMCVQAAFYTQSEGKRTVVHLLNEVNTNADRALPFNNPSMREDRLPVSNIKVTASNMGFTKATLQPEGLALPISTTNDGLEVTVPTLDLHSMVVFE